MEIKPCPCGKTPEAVGYDCAPQAKWGFAYGTCCGEWHIEFRNQYESVPEKMLALALAAWNEAPRKGDPE